MRRTPTRIVASLSPVLIGLAVLGACSSGSSTSASATASPTWAATSTQGGAGGGQRQPGVTGLIAAVSGSTMQVQSQSKQTAVTWSASTTFTKQATGSVADVSVGSCVFVRAADGATASGDTVTASTVQITPAGSDGTCTTGFGGGGGAGGGTPPSGMPTDMAAPTDAPGGNGSGGGQPPGGGQAPTGGQGGNGQGPGGGGVVGKVTAVANGSFTVARITGGQGTTSTASPVTVQTGSSTTVTKTVSASSADATVGQCATAQGQTGDTGAVTATSISLRAPVNGTCFGGGAGRSAGATSG